MAPSTKLKKKNKKPNKLTTQPRRNGFATRAQWQNKGSGSPYIRRGNKAKKY